jgi:hypothetical protein
MWNGIETRLVECVRYLTRPNDNSKQLLCQERQFFSEEKLFWYLIDT